MTFSSVLAAALLMTFLALPPVSGGWLWDIANGTGYAALAVLVYLFFQSGRSGESLAFHRRLGWCAVVVTLMHVIAFPVMDSISVEYLLPKAPAYMLAGIVGLVTLTVVVATSEFTVRPALFRRSRTFRRAHTALALLCLAGVLWHVVGSRFYVESPLQQGAVVLLLAVLPVFAITRTRRGASGRREANISTRTVMVLCVAATAVFAGLRAL